MDQIDLNDFVPIFCETPASPLQRNKDAVCRFKVQFLAFAQIMKTLLVVFTIAALAGCGVETATTAATGAAVRKQELEEGKITLEQVQQKVGQAMEQVRERAEKNEER
jgi:hypothetical protein